MIYNDLANIQFYAGTFSAPRSEAALTRLIKRACYGIFTHIAVGYEKIPHSHCHILAAGNPTQQQLAKFQHRLSEGEVWLKQLTTLEAITRYRDYALGIGRYANKPIIAVLLIKSEIFFSPFTNEECDS